MIQNGFILCQGKNLYFLPSEKQKKCKSVTDAFIKALCKLRNLPTEIYLESKACRDDIEYRYSKGTYELRDTGKVKYHHFEEKCSIMNFPLDDCEEVVFL